MWEYNGEAHILLGNKECRRSNQREPNRLFSFKHNIFDRNCRGGMMKTVEEGIKFLERIVKEALKVLIQFLCTMWDCILDTGRHENKTL